MIKGYKSPLIEFIRANPGCTSEEIEAGINHGKGRLTAKIRRELKKTGESIGVKTFNDKSVGYNHYVIERKVVGIYCIDSKVVKSTFDIDNHRSVRMGIISEALYTAHCELYKNRGKFKTLAHYRGLLGMTREELYSAVTQLKGHGCVFKSIGLRGKRSIALIAYEKPVKTQKREAIKQKLQPTNNQLLNGVFR